MRALPLQRRLCCAPSGIALLGVLLALPACLNPDISDEAPVTRQAPALDLEFEEGDGAPDFQAEPGSAADEDDRDDDEPDTLTPDEPGADRNFRNPRRRMMGRR